MGAVLLQAADIDRALTRIAFEIIEANKGPEGLVLLGIPTRGVPLATRIAQKIEDATGASTFAGSLDITMYRDDIARKPLRPTRPTQVPPTGIDGSTVVLVDDVLYSGRSIRAALDALADIGRPKAVRLAVLVDRGHREFPIRADYVGKNIPSASHERVSVEVTEIDGEDRVVIE